MRWVPRGRSRNILDRRGTPAFGGRGAPVGLGIGGILVLLVLSAIFGQDFLGLLSGPGTGSTVSDPARDAAEEEMVQFVSFVLDDTQQVWQQILPSVGTPYQDARLVLFRDAVDSTCGFAEAATGPFYCPGDQNVYIDLTFFEELRSRFRAPGDFAQGYVLAHEIGHHVQNLLGIADQVRRAQRANPGSANALSVRLELQADCFAGIWGHSTRQRNLLEQGDIEEGLNAAAAIGDDRLQRMAQGRVSPDSFTHGTSQQRATWFRRGFESGMVADCDTFRSRTV